HGLTKLDAKGVQDSLEETAQFITENGDTDLLIYQGNETGGAYQVIEAGAIEAQDLIIVNTNKTDLADSGDVINKLYHEGYHVSNRNETEAQAIRFGDYAESDWVSKSKDYGYKNTNLITSTQWNQENANSSIVLQNNNVVQGQDFEKVETIIPLIVAAAITAGLAYKGEGDAFNGAKELRQEFNETEVGQAVAKGSEIIATNIIKGADYSLEALTNEEALATKALIELNEQYQKLPEGTRDVLDFAGFVFAAAGSAQLGKAATHKIVQQAKINGSWLKYHEGGDHGGHTIERHVGKSDEFLVDRVNNPTSVDIRQSKISGASSYTNMQTAQRVISETINQNRNKIQNWLRNSNKPTLVINNKFDDVIGRGVLGRGSVAQNKLNAKTVLKKDGKGGYSILTSYPR
ncbi:hypothetical protein OAP83_01495, partial [Rickettsiales bacterium]|nr:hypothetical protein [Rickettsiales bacterium]